MKGLARVLAGILLAVMLGGCAPRLSPPPAVPLLPAESTLWKLTMRRGGKPLYAGLLLLSRGEGEAGMVLLDATGIKLLEGRVNENGEMVGVKALRPVAERGLPSFLGRVVQRLFLLSPPLDGETCRAEGVGKLCQGLDETGKLVRVRIWGPFVLWVADYSINNESATPMLAGARLAEGWLTPEVGLERRLELPE